MNSIMPWTQLTLPPELTNIRAMLSHGERQYLTWLTAEKFEGWGAIVDLGPWLGASSAMLAEGLKRQGKTNKVVSYDLFTWDPSYMDEKAHEDLKAGDDFRHLAVREVGDYISWIEFEKRDLMNSTWTGGPIEILFVDAAKTWELTNAIFKGYGPHLVPGRSRVVLQDFRHHGTHWLPLIFDSRPDIWKEVEGVEDGHTVTFIPLRPLDGPTGIHPDYSEESFPLASADHLLRRRIASSTPYIKPYFLQSLYKKYLIEGGPLDEIRKLRAEVIAEGVEPHELARIENIEGNLLPRGWVAYGQGDYETSQMLAERCIKASGDRPRYALSLLAMTMLRLGDRDGARALIDEIAARHPDFLLAKIYQAELALVEGRYSDAEVDARHVVEGSQADPAVTDYARSVLQQALNAAR